MKYCFLLFLLGMGTKLAAQTPTFNKDIAPIIHNNCTPCHRPGEAAPFSLITYEDVSKRAKFIKEVVESRFMPPWKPANNYVHFANDRSLSQQDINTIVQWIDAKAPEGAKTAIKNTVPILEGTSYNRKPDLVLKQVNKYIVPGDNLERFIVYKIPFELPDSANVEAIEFFSNNKKLIHHANFAIHPVPEPLDIYSAAPMVNLTDQDRVLYDQYMPFKKTMTYYGGWIPGTSIENYPQGIGWIMPKRGVILMTVHYGPSAKGEDVVSGVNFFFTKKPVERVIQVISLGSAGVGEEDILPRFTFIPPNKVSTFTLQVANRREERSVLYVWPHMHLLGKEFKSYAVTPELDTIPLVHIPQWDFRWQEIYRVKRLIRLPKGAIINIEGHYDNTSDNPFNPHDPPEAVYSRGDMKTDEEMMTLILVFLPYRPGDENLDLVFKK